MINSWYLGFCKFYNLKPCKYENLKRYLKIVRYLSKSEPWYTFSDILAMYEEVDY